jgi:hypothetical protein
MGDQTKNTSRSKHEIILIPYENPTVKALRLSAD